eukprot:COSAG02_NODE_27040_length_618_cov_1.078998_1_plen_84_part_00
MLLSAPGMDLGPLPPHTVLSTVEEPLSSGFEALFGLDGVLCAESFSNDCVLYTRTYAARRYFLLTFYHCDPPHACELRAGIRP